MSIVTTEVENIIGGINDERLIWFRCQDHTGVWHSYGPVRTRDSAYTPADHLLEVAEQVQEMLEQQEEEVLIGDYDG